MKFKKILTVCIPEFALSPIYWKRINSLTNKRVSLPEKTPDLHRQLKDTDCLLVWFNLVTKEDIDAALNLKYIGVLATGFGRIDIEYARKKGILVCNVPGYSTESVAEFVFAILLEHLRDLGRAKNQAREGNYSESTFKATELKNKKLGIIGLGKIGGRVAEIALGFGMDVAYWSKTRKKNLERKGIKYKEINNLTASSDFISLHLAKTPQTEKILNASLLAKIKKGAMVINTAPMELVDIPALEKRLKKNDITFILDHSDEITPKDAEKLSRYQNCILYPPIGYVSQEAKIALQEIFLKNIENFLQGKPTNRVN